MGVLGTCTITMEMGTIMALTKVATYLRRQKRWKIACNMASVVRVMLAFRT
jgi:hypothetical protein